MAAAMSNVIPFEFKQSKVRIIDVDGEPRFVAKDVAEALGYANTSKAVNSHCKRVVTCPTKMGGQARHVQVIPESDVYRLVIKSKLPAAEEFEEWVMEEVLPAIRKYGSYSFEADRNEAREEGKLSRRVETAAIQDFVEYAIGQGSKNAKMYFGNITKLVYKMLFAIKGGSPGQKNFRDTLDPMQLSFLTTAEYVVTGAIQEGLEQQLPYKEIYPLIKSRIEAYVSSVGQTPLLPDKGAA
jgi:prophage antirepressor-like protein